MKSELGVKLRSLRDGKRIGIKVLARKLSVDRAHLSRIESGKTLPSERLLKRLCKSLGADYEEFSILCGRLPADVRRAFARYPREVSLLVRNVYPRLNGNGASLVYDVDANGNGSKKYRLIDLFCGAGGFTRGFVNTGRFESVFANDIRPWAAATFNANFGGHCVTDDINDLLERKDFEFPQADVVIGGPPCQGFSLLNKKRLNDPRKTLWLAYMEVVRRARPYAFVMENVQELLMSEEFGEIRAVAEKLGYRLVAQVLNAADFGVPQRRRRAIIVGVREGAPVLPVATHRDPSKLKGGADLFLLPWRTVREAIADLPGPEGTEARVGEIDPPMDLHFGRTPLPSSVERYKCIPEGGNRFDLLRKRRDLTPNCWIRKKSGGTDLFGRLWWDRPAFTIRTEFYKPEKGRYLHPSQHRPITHREAARFQTFPDDFGFMGTKIQIAIQIGNAVPCLLAQRIAEALVISLDSAAYHPLSSARYAALMS